MQSVVLRRSSDGLQQFCFLAGYKRLNRHSLPLTESVDTNRIVGSRAYENEHEERRLDGSVWIQPHGLQIDDKKKT